jgi:hypothetical protein
MDMEIVIFKCNVSVFMAVERIYNLNGGRGSDIPHIPLYKGRHVEKPTLDPTNLKSETLALKSDVFYVVLHVCHILRM